MTISAAVFNKIRSGIVAIGYARTHWKEALNPHREGGPDFEIVGTGFLVSPETVITNRHVLVQLAKDREVLQLVDEQLFMSFVFRAEGSLASAWVRIIDYTYSPNPQLDVGFLDLPLLPEPDLNPVQPLSIAGTNESLRVSQAVCICGYPYGTAMLERDGMRYRFGPVLQQGFISAISPYDDYGEVTELLLDARTAGGMSGSPVFLPDNGIVIGIHHEGWEATTALAVPLTESKVGSWLRQHQMAVQHRKRQREEAQDTEVNGV